MPEHIDFIRSIRPELRRPGFQGSELRRKTLHSQSVFKGFDPWTDKEYQKVDRLMEEQLNLSRPPPHHILFSVPPTGIMLQRKRTLAEPSLAGGASDVSDNISCPPKKKKSPGPGESSTQNTSSVSQPHKTKKYDGSYLMAMKVRFFNGFLRMMKRPRLPPPVQPETTHIQKKKQIKALSQHDSQLFDSFIKQSLEASNRRSRKHTAQPVVNLDDDDDDDDQDTNSMNSINIGGKYHENQPKKRTREEDNRDSTQITGTPVSRPEKRARMSKARLSECRDRKEWYLERAPYQYHLSTDAGSAGFGTSEMDLPNNGEQRLFGNYEQESYGTGASNNGYGDDTPYTARQGLSLIGMRAREH